MFSLNYLSFIHLTTALSERKIYTIKQEMHYNGYQQEVKHYDTYF